MAKSRHAAQPDLFGAPEVGAAQVSFEWDDPDFPRFREKVRAELVETLAKVTAAETPPWSDLTQTTLGELRFRSMSRWLPAEEAAGLVTAFDIEMLRIYRNIGEA